jgi:hypothetical protein
MIRSKTEKIIWSGLLMTLVFLIRTSDHMPNVVPVAAIALWAGAVWPMPGAVIVPLTAMLMADAVIGLASWPVMLAVYLSYGLITGMGRWMKKSFSPGRIAGSALMGAAVFYLITNAAVWWFDGIYPRTMDGLILSYFYALPFFRSTLLGDLAYTSSLFVSWYSWPIAANWAAKKLAGKRQAEGLVLRTETKLAEVEKLHENVV